MGGDRDRLIEVMDTLDVATQVVVPQIHRLGEHAAVAERRELTVDGLAETHWVGVYGFEDGLVRRLEIFALDDFDAALAHYDELVAGAGTT